MENLLLGILSFSLIIGVYLVFKQVVWGSSGMHLGEQARSLIAKDYYNPALGSENIQGFIQRLLANADFLHLTIFLHNPRHPRDQQYHSYLSPF